MVTFIKNKDLSLVSGSFLEDYLPQDKLWLLKYFSSKIQKRFIIYILIFDSYMYFCRHTGVVCSMRYLKKMKRRFDFFMNLHEKAKKEFNLELLSDLEMGMYNFKKLRKNNI